MRVSPSTSRSAASRRRSAASSRTAAPRRKRIWFSRMPGPDEHREGARRDLGVERAGVARLDAVELGAAVGDQPREQVEPAGRALGVGDRGDAGGQRQALEQRDEVDAALLQHRAARQVDPVHARSPPAARRPAAPGRKEARTRNASAPRRRSRLAGWTCSGAKRLGGGDRAARDQARGSRGPATRGLVAVTTARI